MATRIRSLFLLIAIALCTQLPAQSYLVNTIPYNPDPFASGSVVPLSVDDAYSGVYSLPFSFCFYGTSYDSIVIGSNGVVTFDLSQANQYCPWPLSSPLPTTQLPNVSIFTPIQDINPAAGGAIRIGTYGLAPYRRFVVSYDSIPMFSCTNLTFTQQVILYESTNVIEIHMQEKPLCPTWNNGFAILGMQKDTTDFIEAPGRTVPAQWSTLFESWRFSPVTSPCYFAPESDTISGKVFMDPNVNCTYDGGDFLIPNVAVLANGGQYYDWTDVNGQYSIVLDTGNWAVTHFLPGIFGTVCPGSGVYNVGFSAFGLHSMNNDFADSVDTYCPDLFVDIGTWNFTRCMTEVVNLNWCNLAWLTDTNIVVTVTLQDSITLDSASVPYTVVGPNTYSFSVGTLTPFQCGNAYLYVSIGCDTAGTVYCMNASISGSLADCDSTNNQSQDCHALTGSYDPNDKRIAAQNFAQLGWVHSDTIEANDRLNYMIRFQNTGTDTAFTVTIRDMIDSKIDISTVLMGASSHPYQWFIANGELLVEFDNIMLPDSGTDMNGSIGYFKFSAQQKAGNGPGDVIYNEAGIYFDQNLPIITNTTAHVLRLPVGIAHPYRLDVKLYPNPGQDRVLIEWEADAPATFSLMNIMGQELLHQEVDANRTEVATAALQSGIYFWKMQRDGQTLASGKWVKR